MSVDVKTVQPEKHLLGKILLRRNEITQDQLEKALDVQTTEGGYLGEVLIHLGYVEERDIVVALVVQCNLPYIAIQNYQIDKSIIEIIPAALARKYYIVPLDRVGNILSVVMADPLNLEIKNELENITRCNIAPFIATKVQIQEAIDRWY